MKLQFDLESGISRFDIPRLGCISCRSATAKFLCKCILHSKPAGPLFDLTLMRSSVNLAVVAPLSLLIYPMHQQWSLHHQALSGVLLSYHLLALNRCHSCLCTLARPVTLCTLSLGLCRSNKEFLSKCLICARIQMPTKVFRTQRSQKTVSSPTRSTERN